MTKNIKKKCIVSIAIIGLIVLFIRLNTWQEFFFNDNSCSNWSFNTTII